MAESNIHQSPQSGESTALLDPRQHSHHAVGANEAIISHEGEHTDWQIEYGASSLDNTEIWDKFEIHRRSANHYMNQYLDRLNLITQGDANESDTPNQSQGRLLQRETAWAKPHTNICRQNCLFEARQARREICGV
jgi:hypothetical protein